MRRLDRGETFIVTRNGTPVGELTPMRRHRFVPTDAVAEMFRQAPAIDVQQVPSRSRRHRRTGCRTPWLTSGDHEACSTRRSSSTSNTSTTIGCRSSRRSARSPWPNSLPDPTPPRIPTSALAGKIDCNAPKPPSIHCRSIPKRLERTVASMPRSSAPAARPGGAGGRPTHRCHGVLAGAAALHAKPEPISERSARWSRSSRSEQATAIFCHCCCLISKHLFVFLVVSRSGVC